MSVFFPKKTGTPPKVNKKKDRDELIETLEDRIIELEQKLAQAQSIKTDLFSYVAVDPTAPARRG